MYQIRINNLPKWISELHLKQYFRSCGNIIESKIALSPSVPRPLGYGFVTFDNEAALNLALAKNGAMFDGSIIEVERDNTSSSANVLEKALSEELIVT